MGAKNKKNNKARLNKLAFFHARSLCGSLCQGVRCAAASSVSLARLFFSRHNRRLAPASYMPCQDKSTIRRRSSVLSLDVWRVLSPGGPIFGGVSSNVSSCVSLAFLLFVFGSVVGAEVGGLVRGGGGLQRAHRDGSLRATASSKWLCVCAEGDDGGVTSADT